MTRRLFTALAALSLLLLVATAVLWVRSYWVAESFTWATRDGGRRSVGSHGGRLVLGSQRLTPGSAARIVSATGYQSAAEQWGNTLKPRWSFLGFRYTDVALFFIVVEYLEVPYWAPAVLFAAAPLALLHVRRLRPRRRRRLGLCPACGYDLRESPGRCPECGRIVGA